jgi:hypothetical protein
MTWRRRTVLVSAAVGGILLYPAYGAVILLLGASAFLQHGPDVIRAADQGAATLTGSAIVCDAEPGEGEISPRRAGETMVRFLTQSERMWKPVRHHTDQLRAMLAFGLPATAGLAAVVRVDDAFTDRLSTALGQRPCEHGERTAEDVAWVDDLRSGFAQEADNYRVALRALEQETAILVGWTGAVLAVTAWGVACAALLVTEAFRTRTRPGGRRSA